MIGDPSAEDPRGSLPPAVERDVRPVVARPPRGLPGLVLVGGAVAAGLLLFGVLDARRRSASAPAVFGTVQSDATFSAPPPPLYLPEPVPTPAVSVPTPSIIPSAAPPIRQPSFLPVPPAYYPQQPYPVAASVSQQPAAPPPVPRGGGGATLVVDTSQAAGGNASADPASGATTSPAATNRVSAGVFANRATTVTQGTLIPAVLETAFDSTRPGFARALVQRDVRGFDGTRVLIPRGSRLIGEYSAQTSAGQKRAMVAWIRLIRPDGVTIMIGSPATDPLGRGGVRAQVNSHFLERFAGAILQSSLDIGVNLASRAGDSPVIVALPGSLQGQSQSVTRQADISPTLSVAQGKSISVFVARDLDFTAAETGR